MSKSSGFIIKGTWAVFLSRIDRDDRERIVAESFEMWLDMRHCELPDVRDVATCEGIVADAKTIADKFEHRASVNRANGALGGRPPKPTDKPTVNPMVKTEKPNGLQAEKTPPDALETQRFNVGLGKERKGMERNGTERNGKELNTPLSPRKRGGERVTGFDGLAWVKAEQRAALVAAFGPFWDEYPKVRGSRFEAEKAFAAAVKTWSLAEWQNVSRMFVDAVRAAKASPDWTKDGGRYIPAASVWLNGHRWEAANGVTVAAPEEANPALDAARAKAAKIAAGVAK